MTYQHYTGNKIIKAKPMTRGEFQEFRAGTPGGQGEYDQKGYVVEYEDGYTSWSPADVFEKAYIAIGNGDGLPAFLLRLKGERAENYDRLQKLGEFLYKQELLNKPAEELTEAQAAAIANLPRLSLRQLALQQEQYKLMAALEDVLTARYEDLHPEARVEHRATVRFSVANGTVLDLMGKTLMAVSEDGTDLHCYTGIIYNLPADKVKLFDPQGAEMTAARIRTEKLVRGFSISGNANSDILFDIALDRETGRCQVTSSFTEDYQIELEVQLASSGHRVL